MRFPSYIQYNLKDCGPTCLKIISKYYGRNVQLSFLRKECQVYRDGASLSSINAVAQKMGFKTSIKKISWEDLKNQMEQPCIIHLRQNHYVVLYKISSKHIFISDPAIGRLKYDIEKFLKLWIDNTTSLGIVLFLKPTQTFYSNQSQKEYNLNGYSQLKKISSYLFQYKRHFIGVFISVIIVSALSVLMPYLAQAVIDKGISSKNISLILLILIAQIMVVIGQASANIIRNKLALKISTNINIFIISDFLSKLMKLPISFFEATFTGDVIQRIRDCDRVQVLFTSTIISMVVSILSIIIYSAIIGSYNANIFFVFLTGSILYVIWILSFLKYRKKLDYLRFQEASISQNNIVEMMDAIYEIKLNNIEQEKITEWEQTQQKLYQISQKRLDIAHLQEAGGIFIDQLKNVSMSFFAAYSVVEGSMTLGMMMALQYIIGQLNSPIIQSIQFIQSIQDSKIAIERIGEIHNEENEDEKSDDLMTNVPVDKDIKIRNVSFRYPGAKCNTLTDINFVIPFGKTTAIVGSSGSGKTTLLKLLLKFYLPTSGDILLGNININNYNSAKLRKSFGVVMQNGYIFSNSIKDNISIHTEECDMNKVYNAAKIASIDTFIDSLPRKYDSIIGYNGIGLSSGQKQRLLIARAIYKNASYIFLDEATNALDAKNEYNVVRNLKNFCKDKTLVVIAHRLSTVKNADQIIVLDAGKVIELGTHESLIKEKGVYYNLIKNQLELN
ncbi:peptidase domain-containing ABC transporter [Bacteroides sp. 3_1_33FAA]|nr:peptidase domain-containing ABC transporter [Bacteroides sp. 3_1_33FAA]